MGIRTHARRIFTRRTRHRWYKDWKEIPRTRSPVYAVHMQSRVFEPGEGFSRFTRWIAAPNARTAAAAAARDFDDADVISVDRETFADR